MSNNTPAEAASSKAKLPRLPKNARVQKRPLMHPPIASAKAGAQLPKVIYVSSSASFIPTIKRVRKFLHEVDKRASGNIELLGPGSDRQKILSTGRGADKRGEEVLVKGTGRAIEKVLQVALFFQGQDDCLVRLRTGSLGAIDDIIVDGDGNGHLDVGGEEVPETRVRKTSVLEVGVSLR
ncbi:MAG: hypothetical protein M1818_001589 [Claussenomyces sp. TS43310]|nr:MAG: hypothetical protein M1818_001589 [Claussenomyces sp. TS43310]